MSTAERADSAPPGRAAESEPSERAAELFAHPGVDWPTLALLVLMWGGLAANLAWAAQGGVDLTQGLAHVLIAVASLNLSFTIWHEAVHGTVFRSEAANHVVGVLGAWPAWIPYFLIRRGHKLHHEHVNDPERDPDAWFNEGSILSLPFRYLGGVARTKRMVEATDPPTWERRVDTAQALALLLAFVLVGWLAGPVALILCWMFPKGIVMWIHAWYVNVLPHRDLPSERFRDTRIFSAPWLALPTVMHSYHGVHHAWQTVPWHRYARVFRAKRAFLEQRGTPIRTGLRSPAQ